MSGADSSSVPGALVVAIDGPSGTGKSTISKRLAADLGLAYLDTGAMYRALTWWCLHTETDLADSDAVAEHARTLPLRVGTDPHAPTFAVGDHEVTADIRMPHISTHVSAVATNLAVRAELQRRQREMIAAETVPGGFSQGRGIVAEGRDITTVVAPDATVRILLVADEHARLARRSKEVYGSTDAQALQDIRDQVLRRDADDGTVSNFTTAQEGVITVDTSQMSLDEAVAAVRQVVEAAR